MTYRDLFVRTFAALGQSADISRQRIEHVLETEGTPLPARFLDQELPDDQAHALLDEALRDPAAVAATFLRHFLVEASRFEQTRGQ